MRTAPIPGMTRTGCSPDWVSTDSPNRVSHIPLFKGFAEFGAVLAFIPLAERMSARPFHHAIHALTLARSGVWDAMLLTGEEERSGHLRIPV